MSTVLQVGDVIAIQHKRGKYVVEQAELCEGDKPVGYARRPDFYRIGARKLNPDMSYNPNRMMFNFSRVLNSNMEGIKVVGKMKKTVTFECV